LVENQKEKGHFGIVWENVRAITMGIIQQGPDDMGLVVRYCEHGYEPSIHTRVHSTCGSLKAENFSNR